MSSQPPPIHLTPPQIPIRIAVLEADTLLPGARAKYGSYTGLYTALLQACTDSFGWPPDRLQISGWDVVNSVQKKGDEGDYPRLEDLDVILISGSKHSAFENYPWILRLVSYTQSVLSQSRVRIIGVCFGHQIVGRALGTAVTRSPLGFEVSVCEVQLTEKGKELFDGKEVLHIMGMHRDILPTLPAGTELLGSSPKCTIQGFYAHKRLITVQWHPEFNEDVIREVMERRREQGIFDQELYEDGMRRADMRHDGDVVAKAFLRFLTE